MIIDVNKFHKKSIQIAKREKLLLDKKQCTIAFIVDSKGRTLREGWNSLSQTHPIQKKMALSVGMEEKEYLHAEVHALTRLGKKSKHAKGIVVIRLDRNFDMLLSKPCTICEGAIEKYGIDTIVHS